MQEQHFLPKIHSFINFLYINIIFQTSETLININKIFKKIDLHVIKRAEKTAMQLFTCLITVHILQGLNAATSPELVFSFKKPRSLAVPRKKDVRHVRSSAKNRETQTQRRTKSDWREITRARTAKQATSGNAGKVVGVERLRRQLPTRPTWTDAMCVGLFSDFRVEKGRRCWWGAAGWRGLSEVKSRHRCCIIPIGWGLWGGKWRVDDFFRISL